MIDPGDAGAQPMHDSSGQLVITYNGEIYNFRQLREELRLHGATFSTDSDTEVLLAVYRYLGIEGFKRLRGMYAFVIWDAGKNRLVAARDVYGIKPLYIAETAGHTYFASQCKALAASEGVSRSISPVSEVCFKMMGSVPEPFTILDSVRAIAPGTCVICDEHGIKIERFLALEEVFRQSSAETSCDPLQAVSESVEAHLVSDVPVAVMLSSGLDSSAITSLASARSPVTALTLRFAEYRGSARDEITLASELTRHLGIDHQQSTVDISDFRSDLEDIIDQMDQPTIDGVNTWFVSKLAKQHGIKVLLSGVGGDELFGSYPSFAQIPPLQGVLSFLHIGRALGRSVRQGLVAAGLRHKVASLLEYGASVPGAYFLKRGLRLPWQLEGDEDVIREGLKQIETVLRESAARAVRARQGVWYLENEIYMRNQLLRDTDWAGMAHGVEIRTPLCDFSLLRQLAPSGLVGESPGKDCLAAALPEPVRKTFSNREKTGFTIPVDQWVADLNDGNGGYVGWSDYLWKRWSESL